MSLHSVYVGERGDGKWSWHVKVGDDIVASDASQGYNNKQDCLHSLFGLWFGTWDESFLDLYTEWQSYSGESYEVPPEAQEGVPVHIQAPHPDVDAPNYEAASADHAEAVAPHRQSQDLGDDPDGDASVDPRDT